MPRSLAPSDARTQGALGSSDPSSTEDAAARSVIADEAPRDVAGRATYLDGGRALVAAQRQPVRRQRLLDLLDRLLAEVRNRRELVLGLHDEIADRLDADPLEAVVGANAELELLDREVLHPVRERHLRLHAVAADTLGQMLDAIDVREDRELLDQDLRCLRDRVLRRDRPVG